MYTSYYDMVRSQGKVIHESVIGDYQGDYIYLVESPNGKIGFAVVGYGSCSGCDALQAAMDYGDSERNLNDLWESVVSGIYWGNAQEIFDYVNNEEANRFYYYESDWVNARQEINEILNSMIDSKEKE
jgi:hypothetical protein